MKKILVTGARSGIINKVCDNLINKNYFLYITVHTDKQLERVCEKYKNNKNVKCFKLDVTDKNDIKKLDNLDIDILINNAAIAESGSICEIDMDKVRNNFEVNVFSNFTVLQKVIKNMIKKKQGKIIIMASLAGILPIPFLGPYCATKASIIKLTECLNMELKLLKANINVCLIEPGLYRTGFNKLAFDKKYEWMDVKSFFQNELELIRKSENIFLKVVGRKNLNSIVKKIVKATESNKPKFVYKAPMSQAIFAKIYNLI